MFSASKLLKNEDALVGRQQKHSGPVHALDFNSFQQNLFATGAGESEIFIWDLNNTSTPMSPGNDLQETLTVLYILFLSNYIVISITQLNFSYFYAIT